ncbi:MAG: hypothetical protein ACR2FS_05570 [Phormidesmis sp.]
MSTLTIDQKIELSKQETRIERGLKAFKEAGEALSLIRDQRLYSQPTFEAYCKERWGMQRAHAYRLISAFEVLQDLSPVGDIPLPQTERQARPLAKLPAELRQPAWETAVEVSASDIPTALEATRVVEAMALPPADWQPQSTSTVLAGVDKGQQVVIVSADPKKPLVHCLDANGKERVYLTTQLAGHRPPAPVEVNRAAAPSKAAPPNYREQAETMLQIERERLSLVEAAAERLAIAAYMHMRGQAIPARELQGAIEDVSELLGLSLSFDSPPAA